MVRTHRRRQFTVEPGQSRDLGTFCDPAGSPIVVAVTVRECDDGARPAAAVTTKAAERWEVDLPPDTSLELDGLQEDDGTSLRVTIVAGPCPGTDAPAGIGRVDGGGLSVDIDAVDVVAEVDFTDDADIAADSEDF